jgi:hypothetical protein
LTSRCERGDDRPCPHGCSHRGDEAQDSEQQDGDRVVVITHAICKPSGEGLGDIGCRGVVVCLPWRTTSRD